MTAVSASAKQKLDRAPDDRKSYAAGFGTTVLSTVSGKPACPAQLVVAHNAGTSTQNIVVATARYDADGSALTDEVVTIPVTAGGRTPVLGPVTELRSSGANVSVMVYWWRDPKTPRNA
jgi:hypothetical protein